MRTFSGITFRPSKQTLVIVLRLAILWLVAGGWLRIPAAAAEAGVGPHRAALVVRFADGSVTPRCVTFSEPSITGAELLARSGLQVVMDYNSGLGGAVCSVAGAGCAFPAEDCFCRCQGLACEYWAYYHWTGGAWQYSLVGASSYQVTDGALEGWSWGPGNWVSGVEPPIIAFDEICATLATATPTPTTTVTPTPTLTPTLTPTASSAPAHVTPPQVTFEATATSLTAGACTLLSWLAWDAERVTLNGAPVSGQDRTEVCPATTQRYVLAATNAAGQVQREITVQVTGPAQTANPVLNLPTALPTNTPVQRGAADPAVLAALPSVLPPTVPPAGSLLAPVVHAQEAPVTALAPRAAERVVTPAGPAVRVTVGALPTATPRPRRVLGADGRATPTPMLVALVQPRSGVASAGGQASGAGNNAGANAPAPISREFTPVLLPGYAFYLLTAAGLVASGAWVLRRKNRLETGKRDVCCGERGA